MPYGLVGERKGAIKLAQMMQRREQPPFQFFTNDLRTVLKKWAGAPTCLALRGMDACPLELTWLLLLLAGRVSRSLAS